MNYLGSEVDEDQLLLSLDPTSDNTNQALYNFWSGTISYRAKVFYPQAAYHEAIYKEILT